LEPNAFVAGEDLLRAVQQRFYPATAQQNFYRDRRMLLYALAWPALWLEQRGLTCSPARYRALIAERLESIAAHGDPARYGAYFPAYLLKCLQDYFQYHGAALYDELKHIRNAIDQLLASTRFAAQVRHDAQPIAVLASAHRLIAAQRSRDKPCDDRQLPLPLA
jgi:hypothetical protein